MRWGLNSKGEVNQVDVPTTASVLVLWNSPRAWPSNLSNDCRNVYIISCQQKTNPSSGTYHENERYEQRAAFKTVLAADYSRAENWCVPCRAVSEPTCEESESRCDLKQKKSVKTTTHFAWLLQIPLQKPITRQGRNDLQYFPIFNEIWTELRNVYVWIRTALKLYTSIYIHIQS